MRKRETALKGKNNMKNKENNINEYKSILAQESDQSENHTEESRAHDLDMNFLTILPLKNEVVIPKSIRPIIVGRASSIKAVEYALKHNKHIFITAQNEPDIEVPTEDDLFVYGARSTILQVMRMPNGALKLFAEGISRAKISPIINYNGCLAGACHDLPTQSSRNLIELKATWRQLQQLYTTYAQLNDKAPADIVNDVTTVDDMDHITDTIAVHVNLSFAQRQEIIETVNLLERMLLLCTHLTKETEILVTEQRIRGRIQSQVDKNQREYYLTEQIKAIQQELGREDVSQEIEEIRKKVRKIGATPEAIERVDKELKRLEQMPPLSSEAVVSRTYVDWIISLPWKNASKDKISLIQAEKILDAHHAGLQKTKDRIVEFLAAKKYTGSNERSTIICLVGPPGVGKTTLGNSIAQSLGREFVRISLGGIKDEAEIRGHRRTYIGALPGKIIQSMKKATTVNPVILLDEIDKMARDFHGDPASALLEVLDPEQNKTFADHFLDLDYDLSQVMFIATANTMDGIPYPLFDRMEIINLSGYTEAEKISISEKFLIPKNLKQYNLTKTSCIISRDILRIIIDQYTKEAGVRQLERIIAKLMRKTIQHFLRDSSAKKLVITEILLVDWLGHPKFKKTTLNNSEHRIGLATGLAWTELGGDILEIETIVLPGKGNLTLTGQLGDVMQESAQAALSYIRSRASEFGIPKNFYTARDIHLHIPEGATPKDGPSAGITIATALVSALTKTTVPERIALTGEITLQGRVLSVGGLKEKLLAAQQHGMKKVIVPHENYDDICDVLKEADLSGISITYVKTMDEVIAAVFGTIITTKPATTKTISIKDKKTIKKSIKKPTRKS